LSESPPFIEENTMKHMQKLVHLVYVPNTRDIFFSVQYQSLALRRNRVANIILAC